MSKLKKFAEAQNKPTLTADEAAHNLYSDKPENIGAPDAGRQVAKPRDIHHIYPDPSQPRRAIPSRIREFWNGEPQTVYRQVIDYWLQLIEEERGSPFDIAAYLNSDEPVTEAVPQPTEAAFLKVVELALAIKRDGLTNPITVVYKNTDHYLLETGERRWLAYHILYHHSDEPGKWQRIPAREVDEFNVWRQASENNARDNLNAIGKARQFSLLLMDLLRAEGQQFKPFDSFEHEQVFYAQVGDTRPPRGKGQQLLNALGAQTSATLTRCRALLQLPNEIWVMGDDLSLPEDTLLKLAKLEPEEAVQEIEKPFESKGFSPQTTDQNGVEPLWKTRMDKTFSPQKWHKMQSNERREAYDYLKSLLLQLETLGID